MVIRFKLPAFLLSLALLSAPRLFAAESPYGINAHAPQGALLSSELDKANAAGIRWVRIDFHWSLVEPSPGSYDWSVYDAIVAAAQARGLSIYASFQSTPKWATDGPSGIGVPRNPAQVTNVCRLAAIRYAGTIAAWGLWNEPNVPQSWAGTRQQYIDTILKPGADGFHAGNASAIVVGPELAHLVSNGALWYRWLPDVLSQAGSKLDVVSHHCYGTNDAAVTTKLDATTAAGTNPNLWDIVQPSLREVLISSGWFGKPLWLTEAGWASDVVGEDAQATYTSGLLNTWFTGQSGKGWISRVFFYELLDDASPGVQKFGILRADLSEKPAYAAYRTFIASPGTGAGSGTARIVPIVLDAFGKGGAEFTSALAIANRGSSSATLSLTYTAATSLGAAGSGTVSETLAAGRQLVVPDALTYLRGKGLSIPTASGSQAEGGTLRIGFANGATFALARTTAPSGSGRAGLAYGAPLATETASSPVLIFGLRETSADRSNVALENAGTSGTITLRVTIYAGDGSGRSSVLSPDTTLAPGQWTQLNSVLTRAGATNGWAKVERVSGSETFLAYGVFNDNVTNDGSYVPALAASRAAATQVVPVLVESSAFESELVLANPTASTLTASLTYVESLASGGGKGTVKETLAPFQQKIIPSAIDQLRQLGLSIGPRGGSYAGALTVAFGAPGAFAGAKTSAPAPSGGGYGVFYAGIAPSEAAPSEAWIFGLEQSASARSNVAFVNAGNGNVTLQYEVWNGATGAKVTTSSKFVLASGAWRQFSGVLQAAGVSQGYVRAVRTAGSGPFIAYGIVNDGGTPATGTNDGSYVEMSGIK